ncbi:tyrosine-type recombinase/integrase [Actinomarinicola tropica]|uniref:tyrosine-type recombinase/integrase n=1 Tax=Actinomarinicola tropica TaxID=2789776 RepID=UPI001E634C0D|nr:tyrosine-type recombinase/integrase [Actinomarinicola tropica]
MTRREPGSAQLVLADGVVHLDVPEAVWQAMCLGWSQQQQSRMLRPETISQRLSVIRRFREFTGSYPWQWHPADVEEFTVAAVAGGAKAHATIRGYQNHIALFCEYLIDRRYEWVAVCEERFGAAPAQICHEWNTVDHVQQLEAQPARRPLDLDELEALFAHADERVEQIQRSGRKGAVAALRNATAFKVSYAWGLRLREMTHLDLVDRHRNPKVPGWGRYGALRVRFGKSSRGSAPKQRTVLTVPEMDWAVEALQHWVEVARPLLKPGQHPAIFVTERRSRMSEWSADVAFAAVRERAGLDSAITHHCLRHSYVTHLLEHYGYPELFVQQQVGHAYASTTAIYSGVSDEFKNRILADAIAANRPEVTR